MSSTTVAMPALSAARRPRSSESDDDSRSGMRRPRTRSAPRARAHNAAHTLLSTPPDSPSTTPRFRMRRRTVGSMAATISSVACAASTRSRSSETLDARVMAGGLEPRALRADEPHDAVDRVDVLGHRLLVANLDLVACFEEREDFHDPNRVDEPAFGQRLVAGQARDVAEGKVLAQKRANLDR